MNYGLKHLDLSWNCIRFKGAVGVAQGLKVSFLWFRQPVDCFYMTMWQIVSLHNWLCPEFCSVIMMKWNVNYLIVLRVSDELLLYCGLTVWARHHRYTLFKSLFYKSVLYVSSILHHTDLRLSLFLFPPVASQSTSFILKQCRF